MRRIPRSIEVLFRVTLFGTPEALDPGKTQALWRQHVADSLEAADSRCSVFFDAIRTMAGHIVWRLQSGPPTLIAPAIGAILIGAACPLLALTGFYAFTDGVVFGGIVGLTLGVLLLLESSESPTLWLLRVGWGLTAVGAALSGLLAIAMPILQSDRIIGVALLMGALSVGPLAIARRRDAFVWRPWLGLASCLVVMAIGNLASVFEDSPQSVREISAVFFAGELVCAVTFGHFALQRRTAQSALTTNP